MRKSENWIDQEPAEKVHNSGQNVAVRSNSVNADWNEHSGLSINAFSPKNLSNVRSVLVVIKTSSIASQIVDEAKQLWLMSWIPYYQDDCRIYYEVIKCIDMWTASSRRPINGIKTSSLASLDSLMDNRPSNLRSQEALENHPKKTRNEHWQDDIRFFEGQQWILVLLPASESLMLQRA